MRWRIQFIFLVVAMFGIIFGGIHLAEKGIQRVEGTQDGPAQSFHIARIENGRLDMTVLGKDYTLEQEALSPVLETFSTGVLSTEPTEPQTPSEPLWENWRYWGNWLASNTQKLFYWLLE